MTDDDIRTLVRQEAPYFRRLGPLLVEAGFKIAARSFAEHEQHALARQWRSDCAECLAPGYALSIGLGVVVES